MKKLIFLVLAFALTLASFSQQITPKEDYKQNEYYKKSSNQKTVGWVLTGTGTLALIVTAGVDAAQTVGEGLVTVISLGTVEAEHKSYTVPYLLSAACIVSGICFLMASSTNKKKARDASVFIDMENAPILQGTVLVSRSFPSVGIKIRFITLTEYESTTMQILKRVFMGCGAKP
jgi:hypothetical protein